MFRIDLPDYDVKKHQAILQFADHALRLAQIGDLEGAANFFERAISLDGDDLNLKYNLAIVEEQLGHIAYAATLLTQILHSKPANPFRAATALSHLLNRFLLDDYSRLSPRGLCSALVVEQVALQPIVDAGLTWLEKQDPDWINCIHRIEIGELSEADAGRHIISWLRVAETSTIELLHLCLQKGIVKNANVERVLTGVRSAILSDYNRSLLDVREVFDLAMALMVQGWHNDHAWAETPAESAKLSDIVIDPADLLAGGRFTTSAFVCLSLYRGLDAITPSQTGDNTLQALKPRSLRQTLSDQMGTLASRKKAAQSIVTLGSPSDATSLKIAQRYETAPYPRWLSLRRSKPGALIRYLRRLMPNEDLSFVESECDVLVAGCGTGQQALMVATGHSAKARLLAIDLSRASLAYASLKAQQEKISNIRFLQADILDIAKINSQFDVIYCVGVLHHMTDWREGWRALLSVLRPTGLMNIGLYSAIARKGIRDLRHLPEYPGTNCSDAAARAYRRSLLLSEDGSPGAYAKISRDFYSLNTFRDLLLNPSEAHVSIEEVEAFVDQNNLVFRGFNVPDEVWCEFAERFPESTEPGRLSDWARFETLMPHTFDGMYDFWVSRRRVAS